MSQPVTAKGTVTLVFRGGGQVSFQGSVTKFIKHVGTSPARPLVAATAPDKIMDIAWDRVDAILVREEPEES